MIPNIIHFIYGLDPDFGGIPFMPFHHIAIKSAFEVNKPSKIYFVCAYEPQSEWFDKSRPYIEIVKVKPPKHIFGNPLLHYAHQADVIRLERLIEYGGIYLDLDTICIKPLTEFLNNECVMGKEYSYSYPKKSIMRRVLNKLDLFKLPPIKTYQGLCNAVIMAKPQSSFLRIWYDTYRYFRSHGKDVFWGEQSIKVSGMLSQIYRDKITCLDEEYFFLPSYNSEGLRDLFERKKDFPSAFVHHLWENIAWRTYLSKLSVDDIKNIDTTYNLQARKYL